MKMKSVPGAIMVALAVLPAAAKLTVDTSVSDNCVLLQNAENVVKGSGVTAGAQVSMTFGGASVASATADADGKFVLTFNPGAANKTARQIVVTDGTTSQTISNVLVGEVWYVSGQSNAEYPLGWEDFSGRIDDWTKDIDYPAIRVMTVPFNPYYSLTWQVCSNENYVNVTNMSATGFFFAKALYKHFDSNVPVGIVVAAKGGTKINAWVSREKAESAGLTGTDGNLERDRTRRIYSVAMRGSIWYQGEADGMGTCGKAYYVNWLTAYVEELRTNLGRADFPVLVVGLPRYADATMGIEARWPAVREAQEAVAAKMSGVACVPAIDLGASVKFGDANCIHPDDKPELADRLLLAARNLAYGEPGVRYRCPYPSSAVFNEEKTKVIVSFTDETTLQWTNGTAVAYADNPFRVKNAAGTVLSKPVPTISSDGRSLEFEASSAVATVDYCQNHANPEIQIVDAQGFPLAPFVLSVTDGNEEGEDEGEGEGKDEDEGEDEGEGEVSPPQPPASGSFETAHGAFAKRIAFTASGYAGSSTLSNFPVLVRLSTAIGGFDYKDCANGANIVFTDANDALLQHEIDTWDASGISLVWVNVASLAKNAVFYMYFDGTASEANVSTAAWNSDYVGVWHMSEASGDVADATGHGLTAVAMNAADGVQIADANGVFGNGRVNAKSGATKPCLNVANDDKLDVGNTFTMSAWVKVKSAPTYTTPIFSRRLYWHSTDGWSLELTKNAYPALAVHGADNDTVVSGSLGVELGSWAHVAVVYNGTEATVYVNGEPVATGTIAAARDNDAGLAFGQAADANGDRYSLFGSLDEFRLLDAVATADWVKAEYDQAGLSFLSNGGVETGDSPSTKKGGLSFYIY